MMQPNAIRHVPVVIVGAGPTGVTAATLLAQYGIQTLVLDRWAGVYPQPRAVHMDDEICRIVARLGLADGFAAISRPGRGLRLLDTDMRVLAEFHRDTARSQHGFPQANMFDQPDFEALLRANLQRYPAAELRGNAEVTEVFDDGRGRVRVTFADRADGSERVVDADYVLGCDGANSLVRTSIGVAMRDLRFQQRWLVVDVATSSDLGQWEGVHQVCDAVRAGTYMRIGDSRYRWEFRLRPGERHDDYRTLAALGALIAPWTSNVPDDDLQLIRVAEYTFRAQIADRWRRGNVFLLGDAAHLTPPFIGQGMGAGLRDAMNLAWKLAGVINRSLPTAVLDSYEQERKPHARHMIRLALTVGWSMTAGGEIGNAIRRVVLPWIRLLPALRESALDSRTPPLHRSAFVRKSRRRHQLAGTLCPNPTLANGGRLDAELGQGFAIISTETPAGDDRIRVEQRGAIAVVAEPDSELAGWLRRGHATGAIVRPDRVVMCSGRDVSALCRAMPDFASGRVQLEDFA
jgi:3-(3-hydroxy-phenyl)propionate hydroxylase